jgi:uncharacterized hydrophobic protein (TIGR00271 family)
VPKVDDDEIIRMREAVFFDGPNMRQRVSRFWILLLLASVIAAAGVVGDSTATVIGAMIVAPLMLPIQGTMLGVVLGDRANLARSILLVVAGALAAVAIGWLVGTVVPRDVIAATNSQVAARVNPRLIDLLAALGTGIVGSVALVRRDISDTLPGVAIAISLVPPLSVVGLTIEAGAYAEARGALLLFLTNVVAILGTGIAVMALYGVHRAVPLAPTAARRAVNRRNGVLVIVAMVVIVIVPLAAASARIASDTRRESTVNSAAEDWATAVGWDVVSLTTRNGEVLVRLEGPLPLPSTNSLRADLLARGVNVDDVTVELLPKEVVDLDEPAP